MTADGISSESVAEGYGKSMAGHGAMHQKHARDDDSSGINRTWSLKQKNSTYGSSIVNHKTAPMEVVL